MRRLQRTIEEIGWTREVPRLASTERVARAFDRMSRAKHDCVLVTSDAGRRAGGDRLVGIFTSRDFLRRVAAERADLAALTLANVMTPAPRTLRPRDPVAFAINWMALEGFRNVPIVEEVTARGDVPPGEPPTHAILGVLTVWDVMRHLGVIFADIDATPRPRMPTGDVMIDLGGDQ